MPHTFKMEALDNLAKVTSRLVSKDMVLARTVRRDFDAEFAGKRGASVNVRIPASISASSRLLDTTTALTYATLTQGTQAVALTTNNYSAVTLSDEDMTLRIEDFTEYVLAPQALAIAEQIEGLVVTTMQAISETTALDTALDLADPDTIVPAFVDARKVLRDMGAPLAGMYAAVATDVYAAMLKAQIVAGNQGGQGDALANASIGRVGGFTVIESNRLAAGEIVWYHRDAIALVLRAPASPPSAHAASVMVEGGVPVRIVRSYDNGAAQAESQVLSVYSGTATLTAKQSTAGSNVLFALRVKDGA